MRSLNQEFTNETDQGQLDVCEVTGLVELLNYLKHFDEVKPVS